MRVLNRYILFQVARPMLATILIALVALLAERTLRVVDLVVGWRGSLLVVVEMLGYLVPHYMGLAIPVAFFLGVLLTFDRLFKEAELAAIFAAGTGLVQLMRPLLMAAVVLMGFSTLLASELQPFGRYAYRAAGYALTNASFYTLLQPGIFTTIGGTTYMAGTLSDDKLRMGHVFVYHDDPPGGSLTVTAARGEVQKPGAMSPIRLQLHDGVQQIVPASAEPSTGGPMTSSAKAGPAPPAASAKGRAAAPTSDAVPGQASEVVLRFRNFETEFGNTAGSYRPRGEDEREMTMPELWRSLGHSLPHIKPSEIAAEFYGRVVRILSVPLLPFLAIPLALGRIRGQRSYGLVIGLATLIGYNQLLQFGEALVDDGRIPALLGLWLPFVVFGLISVTLFVRAATRVPDPKGAPWLDRQLDRLRRHLPRRGPGSSRTAPGQAPGVAGPR